MKWPTGIMLALVTSAIAALALSVGLSTHFAGTSDETSASRALTWNSRQPDALTTAAAALSETDPESARQLITHAVKANPSASAPLLALARIAIQQQRPEEADLLIEKATTIAPADPDVLAAAGAHWAQRGQPERAIEAWSATVSANPAKRDEIFPIFLAIAEDPNSRLLLRPITAAPPTWWNAFFTEVSRRALDVESVRTLHAMRSEAANAPLTLEERRAYIARLRREGLITEAFLVWVNGLDEEERLHLGQLHNGGFEVPPTNAGFDWHIGRPKTVSINTSATYGAEGQQALQLVFRDTRKRFAHVHQPLFLAPGRYRLLGQVRTDSMQAMQGIKWVLRCSVKGAKSMQLLGESERFLGSSEWREFGFEFEMPPNCENQEIRLVSADYRSGEKIKGSLWFDRLRIRRLSDLPEPAVEVPPAAPTPPES